MPDRARHEGGPRVGGAARARHSSRARRYGAAPASASRKGRPRAAWLTVLAGASSPRRYAHVRDAMMIDAI